MERDSSGWMYLPYLEADVDNVWSSRRRALNQKFKIDLYYTRTEYSPPRDNIQP